MWRRDKAETIRFLVNLTGVDKMLKSASWKTTAGGVVSVLLAVLNIADGLINGTPINWTVSIAAISAGLSLIFARDNDKTSEQVKAK
jgi:uncharacterized membrane protein HdeD (DUF308 family)